VKQLSGKDLVRILEHHRWALLRVRGSHHVFGKPGETVRLSIPIHGSTPLKKGLLAHFLKMAGLSEADL
jgi:predicted RNA binding protein YcfA (HicA-like mRNA interferase family)